MDIIHCDLDAFYAAVEQRDNPAYQGQPVIVGALPGSRGVVATCSYEARRFGVHSAMPIGEAYRLCPQAVYLRPDMPRYAEASRQVFEIFSSFTPVVEPLSIDEAFLDVSGCHRLFGSSLEIARQIKQRVKTDIGLIISVGIAPNKFLAKLASDMSKPDGLLEMTSELAAELLPPLPVSKLWGIGRQTAARLNKAGIYTISDLGQCSHQYLQPILGTNTDFWLDLARGRDTRRVTPREEVKSISNEITFQHDIRKPEDIEKALLSLAGKVGQRLRHHNLKAATITVKIRQGDFKNLSRSTTLLAAVDTDHTLYAEALNLARPLLDGRPLRLIGISCSKLINSRLDHPNLFADNRDNLDKVVDNLKDKYPGLKIGPARILDD